MVTYRIFVDAAQDARAEVCAFLSSAPSGTVVRQTFARQPVQFGEDLYDQLDVVLGGEHAAELCTRLKRRYTFDMQRIGG